MGILRTTTLCLLLAGTAAVFPSAHAAKPPSDPTRDALMLSAGFLSGHPDLRYRLLGLKRFKAGEFEEAFRFYQRAAYFGDKPSQGMVGEMLWNGQGTAKDRALAYAWMDLASERGYTGFMGLRERYWEQLTDAERNRAVDEGQAIYARFGDQAAQPRLATILRREKRRSTGSRTGFTGNLQIYIPGPGGFIPIEGSKFYDDRYWDPKQYQAWHDEIWMKPRIGRVSVGSVEQVQGSPPPASRIPLTTPEQDAQEPETPEADETDLGTRKDG